MLGPLARATSKKYSSGDFVLRERLGGGNFGQGEEAPRRCLPLPLPLPVRRPAAAAACLCRCPLLPLRGGLPRPPAAEADEGGLSPHLGLPPPPAPPVFEGVRTLPGEGSTLYARELTPDQKGRRVVLKKTNVEPAGAARTGVLKGGTIARGATETGQVGAGRGGAGSVL